MEVSAPTILRTDHTTQSSPSGYPGLLRTVELWTVVTTLGVEIVPQTASFPSSAGLRCERCVFIHQVLNALAPSLPPAMLPYSLILSTFISERTNHTAKAVSKAAASILPLTSNIWKPSTIFARQPVRVFWLTVVEGLG
jgi:hypothetical protein